jgi:transposase
MHNPESDASKILNRLTLFFCLLYTQPMASIQKVKAGRHTYYRIVESRRVNGKPRPVPLLHLGTADQLLNRLLTNASPQFTLRSYQHGDIAALKAMADRLGLVALIDAHCPLSRRPLSIGTTLVLAALNRAVWPCSKRAWAAWAQRTSVHRLFDIHPETLTSQYFWEQMDAVSEGALAAIEADLTRKIVHDLHLKLDTLFYDTSNFFTYLASGNDRCSLAQRGHSKQKRFALRQFSLALLVTRDGQIPLYTDVYEGNMVDATRFPASLTAIRQRVEGLVGQLEDLTLVYDKGNNSKANQALVDHLPVHYVASLVPTQHPELSAIPTTAYTPLETGPLATRPVYRCRRLLWGAERTVVLFISAQLRRGQIRGLQQQLTKRLAALWQWQQRLAKPHSGPRTPASAQKQVAALLPGQYIPHVLKITYDGQRSGAQRLAWEIDQAALDQLETEVFGKRLLITDQHEWTTEEIILAYRGQSQAEAVFRQFKDVDHLAVRPQYHWTDQKIRVHTFICLLALLLCRLVERESRAWGYQGSLSGLLDLLSSIRLAMVLWPAATSKGSPRCGWVLEESAPDAWNLYQRLVPPKPPFVYTAVSP